MPLADGAFSIIKLTSLCLANSYKEAASPSLESMDDEKNFAIDVPNLCAGSGFITDCIAILLKCHFALALFIRIFRPQDEKPNTPEDTTTSPGFAPFLFGTCVSRGKAPTRLQLITISSDLLVSPPTILTPNSFDAI